MDEAIRRKVVIRQGKRIRKKVLTPQEKKQGYKVQDGKKKKMSAIERMKRKRAARKELEKQDLNVQYQHENAFAQLKREQE